MTARSNVAAAVALAASVPLVAACSDGAVHAPSSVVSEPPATTAEESAGTAPGDAAATHPDVLAVEPTDNGDGTWDFAVTLSSPYDSPERYADGWRIVGPDGTVYGEHTLAHDHAAEQPFTRTQRGVSIPDRVTEVTVEGRDTANGYGGTTRTTTL